MTDITIPPEALEAAAKAMWKTDDPSQWELGMARAACLAMLKAWPGMEHDQGALVTDIYRDPGKIILPLPKEASDE
jgi:hypothetical protein